MQLKTMNFFQKIIILLFAFILLIIIPTTAVAVKQQQQKKEGKNISILLSPVPDQKESFYVELKNNTAVSLKITIATITLKLPEGVATKKVTQYKDNTLPEFMIFLSSNKFSSFAGTENAKTEITPNGGVLKLATVETQSSNNLTDYKINISEAEIRTSDGNTLTYLVPDDETLIYKPSPITLNKSTPTPTKASVPTTPAPALDPEKQRCVALCNQRYFLCNNRDEDEKGYDYCKTFDKEKCIEECSTSTPESSPSPTPNTTSTVTTVPPAASSPTPSPTPTPTSAPQPPTGDDNKIVQTNICKDLPRIADIDRNKTADIKDFNKMRDCLKNNKILIQEFWDWTKLVWQPCFLKETNDLCYAK